MNVVVFSDSVSVPPVDNNEDCYIKSLAKAIPHNVKHIKNFLNYVGPGGSSHYLPALRKAFSLFQGDKTANRSKCSKCCI